MVCFRSIRHGHKNKRQSVDPTSVSSQHEHVLQQKLSSSNSLHIHHFHDLSEIATIHTSPRRTRLERTEGPKQGFTRVQMTTDPPRENSPCHQSNTFTTSRYPLNMFCLPAAIFASMVFILAYELRDEAFDGLISRAHIQHNSVCNAITSVGVGWTVW